MLQPDTWLQAIEVSLLGRRVLVVTEMDEFAGRRNILSGHVYRGE